MKTSVVSYARSENKIPVYKRIQAHEDKKIRVYRPTYSSNPKHAYLYTVYGLIYVLTNCVQNHIAKI